MNWKKNGHRYLCAPYQILSSVRGFESWVYSRNQAGCLGREISSLEKAKDLCEKHKVMVALNA